MSSARSTAGIDEIFSVAAEKWPLARAERIARDVYGLDACATVLSSERDQNFRLSVADGRAFVLKVSHVAENPAVTGFQTDAQLHAMRTDAALPIPHLRPTRDGAYLHWHRAEDEDGARQAVRLIDFLPGVPLYGVARSRAQREALGRVLAAFDVALAGFAHPHSDHALLWDMQRAAALRPLLAYVDDPARRALATRYMDRFEHDVAPRLAGLRRQVIHNDLNLHNVMVDEHAPDRVTAILDFGDIVEAPLVVDVAVACAYQLTDAPNPMTSAAELIAAYHAVNPLTPEELDLLPDLIATRLLVTVAITGWRALEHPENRAYILRNNPLSWTGLHRIDGLSGTLARDTIQRALDATPLEFAEENAWPKIPRC